MSEEIRIEQGSIIKHDSPIPYYYQFSAYAEEKITSRAWRAGCRFPSEDELCESLGVSRTVVRQALSELQRKGLIQKQNGKRSIITLPRYEGGLMQTLRGLYEDVAQKGKKLTTRVLNLTVVPAAAEVAHELQIAPGTNVIRLDRLRAIDDVPEVLVTTYIPEALCPEIIHEDFATQSLYEVLANKFGLRIAKGKRTVQAISLDRTEASLLEMKPGSAALLLKSVALLEDGRPLEYFIAKHRGDRSKFEVVFSRS